jgi:hypothetical protein
VAGSTKLTEDGEQHAWILKFALEPSLLRTARKNRMMRMAPHSLRYVQMDRSSVATSFAHPAFDNKIAAVFDARGRLCKGANAATLGETVHIPGHQKASGIHLIRTDQRIRSF